MLLTGAKGKIQRLNHIINPVFQRGGGGRFSEYNLQKVNIG